MSPTTPRHIFLLRISWLLRLNLCCIANTPWSGAPHANKSPFAYLQFIQLDPVGIEISTDDQGSRAMGLRARPVCEYCEEDFGRVQELKRHVKDIHMPRRRCPFCDITWSRPAKIKAHLIADHAEKFTAEVLKGIKALCGQRVTEFLDAYHYIPEVDSYPTWQC